MELIRRWFGRGGASGAAGEALPRIVVLDVESSGLDMKRDSLLAIGAVAVRDECVVVADSLEVIVRPPQTSSRPNILIHGIGETSQRAGVAPEEACRRFIEYAGDSLLVAFHAAFDRAFLERTSKACTGRGLPNPWLDLAELAPAVYPDVKAKSLDEWLIHFGLTVDERHNACNDALATAQLLLKLMRRVPQADRTVRGIQRLAGHARWLNA